MAISQTKLPPFPPSAPWLAIRAELRKKWLIGEHFSIFGLTGSGKTVLELTLINDRISLGQRVVILGTKPRDRVLSAWAKKHRAAIVPSLDKLGIMDRKALAIVVWPKYDLPLAQKAEVFADTFTRVMKKGGITLVIDEAIYLVEQLRLRTQLDELYHAGRACDVSVMANAQRPTWVAKGMATQPEWLVTFKAKELDDRKRIAGMINDESARYWLAKLPRHEFVIAHDDAIYRSHLTKEQATAI